MTHARRWWLFPLALVLMALCPSARSWRMAHKPAVAPTAWGPRVSKVLVASLLLSPMSPLTPPVGAGADDLPSLERCFNAVRKELDAKEGTSLTRIQQDIDGGNWEDLKLFTREYDAGFRGGVLKSAWKQLGDAKQKGIQVSNSFTFDLIALNKAARNADKDDAAARLAQVRQDLVDFLALEPK